jgi:hypothetical protein
MAVHAVVVRAATVAATGAAGAAAYDGAKRLVKAVQESGVLHRTAVAVTAWGLRGVRLAEIGAERARLATGDVVSEARERIGEQAPPPAVDGHGHGHDH